MLVRNSTSRFAQFLLKDRLTDAQTQAIADATAYMRGPGASAEAQAAAIANQVYLRHDQVVRFVLPWISDAMPTIDMSATDVVEIGGGSGPSTMALARLFRQVTSIEIDARAVRAFDVRKATLGIDNAHTLLCAPDEVVARFQATHKPGDLIVLNAVVEHLTETERHAYLSAIWAAMGPGDHLVVVATPNRLAYTDNHTTQQPFLHMVTNSTLPRYLRRHRDDRIRLAPSLLNAFEKRGEAAGIEHRHRLGLGATYHDFETALGEDMMEVLVADGFWPHLRSWRQITIDDRLLVTYFQEKALDVPLGFARGVLDLTFRKPASDKDRRETRRLNTARNVELGAEHRLAT